MVVAIVVYRLVASVCLLMPYTIVWDWFGGFFPFFVPYQRHPSWIIIGLSDTAAYNDFIFYCNVWQWDFIFEIESRFVKGKSLADIISIYFCGNDTVIVTKKEPRTQMGIEQCVKCWRKNLQFFFLIKPFNKITQIWDRQDKSSNSLYHQIGSLTSRLILLAIKFAFLDISFIIMNFFAQMKLNESKQKWHYILRCMTMYSIYFSNHFYIVIGFLVIILVWMYECVMHICFQSIDWWFYISFIELVIWKWEL